ncbi:MAG TPA: ferritin family protein [Patescibacteria group bacterium]|nr:ferritin family protein [Patescibacteria group bacterium]
MTNEEYRAIITKAIANETEAYEFYKGVAEKSGDQTVKVMFGQFATEELGHQKMLQSFLDGKVTTFHFNESVDYKFSETVDKPALSLEMKPKEALALAMKNEEEAMRMYEELAAASTSPEQKKLFQELALMEKGHKSRMEDHYMNVAFAEVW